MRLIGPNGEPLGVLPTARALAHAQDLGYDLVEIAPNSVPPVAKILDFGKYRFAEQQKAKEAKKRQKSVTWKEVRVTPKIDDHDVNTKIKSAAKFLDEGDKLKLTVRFRGRELAHPDRGRTLLLGMADKLKEHGTIERQPLLEGRQMFMVMNPMRQQATGPGVATPQTAAPPQAAAVPAAAAPRPASPLLQQPPRPAPAPAAARAATPTSAAPAPRPAPPAPAPRPAAPAPAPRTAAAPARPAAPPRKTN